MRQQPIKLWFRPAPACVRVRSPILTGMRAQGSPTHETVPDPPPGRKGPSDRDRSSIGPAWRSPGPCGGLRCSAGLSSCSGCSRGVSQVSRPGRLGGGGSGMLLLYPCVLDHLVFGPNPEDGKREAGRREPGSGDGRSLLGRGLYTRLVCVCVGWG